MSTVRPHVRAPRRSWTRAAFALAAPVAIAGFVACESGDVLIGIQAGPLTGPTDAAAPTDSNYFAPWMPLSDGSGSALVDADLGPCLPDGGCPVGTTCEYLVDAGCGLPGECLSSPPAPPAGPTLLRIDLPQNAYTSTRPTCDAAGPPADEADGGADASTD